MSQDPRGRGPEPPQPSQQQSPPGVEAEMDPRPDYGEKTYKGSDKLKGKAAVVTGGDSGIGRAVALYTARWKAWQDELLLLDEHARPELVPGERRRPDVARQ